MKILIVDDDQDVNYLLSSYLEKHGHQVHSTSDPLLAIELIEQMDDVGLVIADLMMPRVDGIDLTRIIKSNPKRKDLPVFLITAYPDNTRADLSLRSGAAMFLHKPIDLDNLLGLVGFA